MTRFIVSNIETCSLPAGAQVKSIVDWSVLRTLEQSSSGPIARASSMMMLTKVSRLLIAGVDNLGS